jgi:Tfp pilus assembly PilM family ATPase
MAGALSEKIGGRHSARGAIELFERGASIAIVSRHKGRPLVSDLVAVGFPPAPEGQGVPASVKAGLVRDALRSRGWRLRDAALILPKNVVTMRLVTLPSIHDAELAEMARFEAQKHIPFNVERHVIAHTVLRKEGVEGSRTLIVAVDRAALEEPLAICREARVEVTSAWVSSMALVEALLLSPPTGYETETFALVNLGWSTVDITIVSDGIVRFTRSGTMGVGRIAPVLEPSLGGKGSLTRERLEALDALSPAGFFEGRAARPRRRPQTFVVEDFEEEDLGAENPGRPEALGTVSSAAASRSESSGDAAEGELAGPAGEVAKWLNKIVQEIQRTHAFAVREFDCPEVGSVYLAGIGSYVGNMDKYLEQHMRCSIRLIEVPGTLEFAAPKGRDLRVAWREFAITIGAAAGTALPLVNLLPPEYTEKLRARQRRRSFAIAGTLAFLLIALGIGYGVRWLNDQRHALEVLQAYNKELAPQVKSLREKEDRIKTVRQIVEDPHSAGAILETITRIPMVSDHRIALIEYHYIKGKGVTIEGHALGDPKAHTGGAAEVEHFRSELMKTKCFEFIDIKQRTPFKLPGDRPEVTKFTLDCLFTKTAER